MPPPSRDELEALVRDTIRQLMERNLAVGLDDAGIRELAESVRGLSASAAVRLVQQAAFSDGRLDASDLPGVRAAKAQLMDTDGPLELVQGAGTLDAVGGMAPPQGMAGDPGARDGPRRGGGRDRPAARASC